MDEIARWSLTNSLNELDYDLLEHQLSLAKELDADEPENTREFLNEIHEKVPMVMIVLEDVTRLRQRVKKALEQLNG